MTHPAEADRIDASLVARYRQAKEVGERSDLLTALGNCVGPTVLPLIRDALRDPTTLYEPRPLARYAWSAAPGSIACFPWRSPPTRTQRSRGCHFCRQLTSSNRTADR